MTEEGGLFLAVLGDPVAQGRPRFFRKGNYVGAFDPEKSKNWKETVKWQAISQGVRIFDGPIVLHLVFSLRRPKSLPKKVQEHTKRPDLDNLIKAIKDALRGIAYLDDSQIVRLSAEKRYGDSPGVEIWITNSSLTGRLQTFAKKLPKNT